MSRLERWLLILGSVLITIFVAAYVQRIVLSRAQLQRFRDLQARQPVARPAEFLLKDFKVDSSLWSEKRIAAYEQSLKENVAPPLAVLRISKVRLEVPVLEGTDELALNQGAGHIAGTARPGEVGNIGIAGHRDGFFRVLKDVGPGDSIELETPSGTVTFLVDQVVLVSPDDVSVLQPRSAPSLTLVTCYPFYYVGSAPQRYIVQASVRTPDLSALHTSKDLLQSKR
jgi:sortase A